MPQVGRSTHSLPASSTPLPGPIERLLLCKAKELELKRASRRNAEPANLKLADAPPYAPSTPAKHSALGPDVARHIASFLGRDDELANYASTEKQNRSALRSSLRPRRGAVYGKAHALQQRSSAPPEAPSSQALACRHVVEKWKNLQEAQKKKVDARLSELVNEDNRLIPLRLRETPAETRARHEEIESLREAQQMNADAIFRARQEWVRAQVQVITAMGSAGSKPA